MIAGLSLMTQCHLVTEDDNERINSDKEVFQWLISVLDCTASGKLYQGLEFAAIEVIQVVCFKLIIRLVFYFLNL